MQTTQIYYCFLVNKRDMALKKINEALERLHDTSSQHPLCLNANKPVVILLGGKVNTDNLKLKSHILDWKYLIRLKV